MGSIDGLTKKIIEDGERKATCIIHEARKEVEEKIAVKNGMMDKKCENILKEAEVESDQLYYQICAEKEMQIRDENLFIKQKVLDQVFEEALSGLKNLDQDQYLAYLKNILKARDLEGYRLIVPKKYVTGNEEELRTFLQGCGVTGTYDVISDQLHKDWSGCSLLKDGVEENYTFDSWIRYYRQEMEREVLDILYGRG